MASSSPAALVCANACSDKTQCYNLKPYWTCGHICCVKTAVAINWCIQCGCNSRAKIQDNEGTPTGQQASSSLASDTIDNDVKSKIIEFINSYDSTHILEWDVNDYGEGSTLTVKFNRASGDDSDVDHVASVRASVLRLMRIANAIDAD